MNPAMAFHGRYDFASAYDLAAAFAGPDGRIATLPDVVDARIASPEGTSHAWRSYATTSSSEFYGLSRAGNPVIAVLHGTRGPMGTREGIVEAYSHQVRDDDRRVRGGRIDRETFLGILDRHADAVVDLAALDRPGRYMFEAATAEECLADPLLAARFGGRDRVARYAAVHLAIALREAEERQDARGGGERQRILRSDDEANLPYAYKLGPDLAPEIPEAIRGGDIYAQLLSIGTPCWTSEGGRTSLQCDVSPHGWNDGTRFVGIRGRGAAAPYVAAPEMLDALGNPRAEELVWVPHEASGEEFGRIVRIGKRTFLRYPKDGASLDRSDPMLEIGSMEAAGDPVTMTTTVGGYHGLVKYDLSEARAVAPAGANVYDILGSTLVDGDTSHAVTLQFHRAEIDASRRLMLGEDVARDLGLTLRLAEILEGRP